MTRFSCTGKKNAYMMYTPPADGRRTYQSGLHTGILLHDMCWSHGPDISDSHSFARRFRSFKRGSLLIPGQVLWHRMGSRYIYNIIRLLLAVVSPISRVCTHEYFFMTCAAYARTRHKRFAQFCASLPLLQNWLSAYPRNLEG